jgi:hypothetical protein
LGVGCLFPKAAADSKESQDFKAALLFFHHYLGEYTKGESCDAYVLVKYAELLLDIPDYTAFADLVPPPGLDKRPSRATSNGRDPQDAHIFASAWDPSWSGLQPDHSGQPGQAEGQENELLGWHFRLLQALSWCKAENEGADSGLEEALAAIDSIELGSSMGPTEVRLFHNQQGL